MLKLNYKHLIIITLGLICCASLDIVGYAFAATLIPISFMHKQRIIHVTNGYEYEDVLRSQKNILFICCIAATIIFSILLCCNVMVTPVVNFNNDLINTVVTILLFLGFTYACCIFDFAFTANMPTELTKNENVFNVKFFITIFLYCVYIAFILNLWILLNTIHLVIANSSLLLANVAVIGLIILSIVITFVLDLKVTSKKRDI